MMKNLKSIVLASFIIAGGVLINSCTLIKDIEYKVKQNPLEMHGNEVNLTINGKFIEKGLHKKVVAEVTPVFIGEDGTKFPFETKIFQGEKAAGNGEVVPKEGKSFVYSSTLPYHKSMANGKLVVNVLPKKGEKESDLIVTDKIADGTIITPLLVQFDDKIMFAKDNLVRKTEETTTATIHYKKNKSEVKSSELKKKAIKGFETFVKEAVKDSKKDIKGINIMSYASPEGEIDLNANLASERASSSMDYLKDLMTKLNFTAGQQDGFITLSPKGEDWEGFKTEVQNTKHEDKDLILRVLEMTSDLVKREKEIKNMAKTYSFLEKDVLPKLRRSAMTLTYEKLGYSDDELKQLSKTNPSTLTIEELLFTATLYDDLNEQLRVYKEAERLFGNDYRTYTNVGCVLYLQNDIDGAISKFEKAKELKSNAMTLNNLGAALHVKGKNEEAAKLFEEAGDSPEASYNKGIIAIQDGFYDVAITNMGDYKTLNLGLATILNQQTERTLSVIDESADADTGLAYYLKAIVGARTKDKKMLSNNLKSAIAKDASYKEKAKKDVEFMKYKDIIDSL